MNNIIGIILSIGLLFSLIGLATILSKKTNISNEGTRKLIHVGLANWWIIAMIFFDDMWIAASMPIFFTTVTYTSYKLKAFPAMERDGTINDLGSIYFPLSLLVLVLFTFRDGVGPYVGAIGALVMGYGDGFAAIIGKKYGKTKYYIFKNQKSIEGSVTMFIFSFAVCLIIFGIFSPESLLFKSITIAAVATVLEGISVFGLDNISVPLLTSLFYYGIFLA